MKYDYGSKPVNGYDYRCFVKHIAPVLPKDDEVFLYRHSDEWRCNLEQIPINLFRNICHWKSHRPFDKVLNNMAGEVNKQWRNALQQLNGPPFQDKAIKRSLRELTKLDGVEVRTASAILTAWNPDQFGIIDFKTLTVLDMPLRYSKKSYVEFRNMLLELQTQLELKDHALRQIELSLWYYYSIQEAGTRVRPDNKRY